MRKTKILCVDDEPSNLRLLQAILTAEGYEFISAADGREALEMLDTQPPSLVLLDVMMPHLNGYEVCRKRKTDERLRHIPVIMLTALSVTEERIKGIEAGAEDFISKPFHRSEVLARIAMLLRVKELNDRLNSAYANIAQLTSFGENILLTFNAQQYDPSEKIATAIEQIICQANETFECRPNHQFEKPEILLSGIFNEQQQQRDWHLYQVVLDKLVKSAWPFDDRAPFLKGNDARIFFYNGPDIERSPLHPLAEKLRASGIETVNIAGYASPQLCIFAINYARDVTAYDASVLRSLATQIMFLTSLSGQMRETESAFTYTTYALARAAEENDEDTGNHIARVGEYCKIIAERLGLGEKASNMICSQAILHDVGKIHIPSNILKKPALFTDEEFRLMQSHTVKGAKIIGTEKTLHTGHRIALTHHERWDGSGYPHGLAGDQIPLEGRIAIIADIYDALRNARSYKPAFDHQKSYAIITAGDGRVMPGHFDPAVLQAFKETASRFEETYERLKG
ncbi:MAG: HD domain-containing phosphohydrolase [Deltaproteobacteria bacterium]